MQKIPTGQWVKTSKNLFEKPGVLGKQLQLLFIFEYRKASYYQSIIDRHSMESQSSVSHVEWDRTTPQDADPHPQLQNIPSRNDPPKKSLGPAGLIASAPVSDVSAPACTNGLWPSLQPVSVAQKNKQSTTKQCFCLCPVASVKIVTGNGALQ